MAKINSNTKCLQKCRDICGCFNSMDILVPYEFCDKVLASITLPMFCHAKHMTQVSFMGYSGVTWVGWSDEPATLQPAKSVNWGETLMIILRGWGVSKVVNWLGSGRNSTSLDMVSFTVRQRGQPFPEVMSLAWEVSLHQKQSVMEDVLQCSGRNGRILWCRFKQQLDFSWSHQIKGT